MSVTFRVRQAGPLVSIQDAGRHGFQRFGVTESGAMDRFSFQLANTALKRDPGQAALEISLGGVQLECLSGSVTAAVAGGSFNITIDEKRYPSCAAFTLQAGSVLSIRPGEWGSWCYLAFAGIPAADTWLGSQSVLLNLGLCGKPIAVGDIIVITEPEVLPRFEGIFLSADSLRPDNVLRAVIGPQDQYFTTAAQEALFSQPFQITADYNRQGVRLTGPTLTIAASLDMPSEPIARGSLQVPGHGDPILLMADHQTTGGYPKIATVISVDQDKFAQLRTRDLVTFQRLDVVDAIEVTRTEHRWRQARLNSVALDWVSIAERLADSNLISGVIDGTTLD